MHFPDLEVCCDWSTFFPLKSADVSGTGTRDEPLKTSAREASFAGKTKKRGGGGWVAIKLIQKPNRVS